ncbi:MAG: glycosyl hydrolase [Bacteroidetes bacterium]|nr:glycosyl hydrolase [Bacteroidota bacterium]
MRIVKGFSWLFIVSFLMLSCETETAIDSLQLTFKDPPHPAKPWVYWINMDGHFTKEGISADLESMKEVGIGGVLHMDVDVGVPRGDVPFMSETWQENFKHTILECERLGLEFTTITGPGWTGTGGPWIDVENSMQHLVPVSINAKGPSVFNQVLPKPQPRVSPYHLNQTEEMQKDLADFYEDVAVYAFPSCDAVIDDIFEKALFIRNPYTSMEGVRPYLPSPVGYPETDPSGVINPEEIIDLTDTLQADGRLEWEVPEGEWTILRMGRRSSGANGRPAPLAGLGFESDKFSKDALESHFEAYFDPLLKRIGPRSKERTTGFTGLDADSWEMSSQNWTPGFIEEFKKRCGYDPWPYFPAYSGRVVVSREITERFLWDVRMVCQDLLLENHIGHMKKLCEDRGLKLSIEPYDMNPTNDLDLGSYADIPMGEFWRNNFNSSWSCIEAASIGHVMGKPIVAAEAFTAVKTYWKETPWSLKNQGDWAFAAGINRFVTVSFAHQPWLDKAPGMMFSMYGLHWERTQTFWPLLSDYNRYLARCSHMMQQGVTISDILYLTPEGAPHVFRPPNSAMIDAEGRLPDKKGYGFDGCSPKILMDRAVVRDGLIEFPGGSSYRVLVLPQFETMTPQLLEKIMELVKAGATVIGSPSLKSPSLVNYPACDETLLLQAEELWGGVEAPKELAKRSYGSGYIYWGGVSSEALYPDYAITASLLKERGVSEDFDSPGGIRYGHRQTKEREIYFLSNKGDEAVLADCKFRIGKGQPELWDPVTGETRVLPVFKQENGITSIPLQFVPYQSYFVVFPRDKSSKTRANGQSNFPGTKSLLTIEGAWEVSFDSEWGGPGKVTFDALSDWSNRIDEGIKYYSGIATYSKSFVLSDLPGPATHSYLNLGEVHEMARVKLNGVDLGVVWCAPWQVDISEAIKVGDNELEIEVANLWPNRLIRDAALPAEDRLGWTIEEHPYVAAEELLPSGLIGPVMIVNSK